MRLLRRIGDIIAANLNDLVDRFEDPEVMLKQAIREMETMIEEATASAARAIAGERLLARDLADHEGKGRRWNTRAEELVAQIATAIEGISAVTWQDAQPESTLRPSRPATLPTPSLEEETVPCDSSAASATSSPRI